MNFSGFLPTWPRTLPALLLLAGPACHTPPASAPAAVRIRWARDPESLDPLQLRSPQAIEALNLLHCGLLQIDFASRQFRPALAATLPQVQLVGDSLSRLTYTLREAAAWDDGRPVLAQDVAFTVKLMLSPGLPNEVTKVRYGFIEDVQLDPAAPRRFTLVCRGQGPDYVQATGSFAILPEAALDPAGQLRPLGLRELRRQPRPARADSALAGVARRYQGTGTAQPPAGLPGCGPYRLAAWSRDQFLEFRRKPEWWADRLPAPVPAVLEARPAALRYDVVPDEAAAALALQRGELHVYPQTSAATFARLQQSAAGRRELAFYTADSYEVATAGFNTRRPALADPLTRQALGRLFDAAGLLKATQREGGRRTVGLISPADRVHYNDSLPLLAYSPAQARALLRRAGWQSSAAGWHRRGPDGRDQQLRLLLRYRPDEPPFETVALQFREAARTVGIPVELRPTEAASFNDKLHAGDFDVYLRTLKGNPFAFNLMPILHSGSVGEGNLTGFGTPGSDRLLEAVAAAGSPARQAQLLRRLQAVLYEQMPLVPLFFLPTRLVATRRLAGVRAYAIKPGYVATAWSWSPPPSAASTP